MACSRSESSAWQKAAVLPGLPGGSSAVELLQGHHVAVPAGCRHENFVRPFLGDAAGFHDHDAVRAPNGGQTVAMTKAVRPSMTRSIAACTRRSPSASRALVASSRMLSLIHI